MRTKKILAGLSAFIISFSSMIAEFPVINYMTESTVRVYAEEPADTEALEVNNVPEVGETTETADGWQYTEENDIGLSVTGYTGSETKLTIPEKIDGKTVVKIGDSAFAKNKNITSVDLGKVKILGSKIFNGCTNLKKVTIPKSVKETGGRWTGGCLEGSSVETVTFEDGIENIPAFVCMDAASVKKIVIPENMGTSEGYTIGESAFAGTALTSFTVSDKVTEVGEKCFERCKSLKSLVLGKNVSKLGSKLVKDCTSLKEMTIPASVKETGGRWDGGCLEESGIEKVILEEGMENIPAYICTNAANVSEVIIPENMGTAEGYTIGESAFAGTALTSFTVSDKVTEIGDECFKGCAGLKSLDLGKNVSKLGSKIADGCTALKEITIPASVKEAGARWAGGCLEGSGVEKVIFEEGIENIPAYVCMDAGNVLEVVMPEKIGTDDKGYSIGERAFLNTAVTSFKLTGIAAEIGDDCFSGCKSLESLDLGTTVTKLGSNIVNGCANLKKITIPASVKETGARWAGGCLEGSGIETVTLSEGLESIPAFLCMNAANVSKIVLPKKTDILTIGESALSGTAVKAFTIPETVTEIDSNAFKGCKLITEMKIPDSVVTMGGEIFADCKSLKSLDLGNGVSKMGNKIVSGCAKLKEITIPASMKESGDRWNGCFSGSSIETVTFAEGIEIIPANICYSAKSVKNIILPENNTINTIGAYAFSGTSISGFEIPGTVTEIKEHAFDGCKLISKMTIPDSVKTIGAECFNNCTGLTELTLGNNVATIGSRFIRGCTGLKELTIPKSVKKTYSYWDSGSLGDSCIEVLTFEEGTQALPEYIAAECKTLKTVYLPDTANTIGNHAFRNCANLERIVSNLEVFDFYSRSFYGCLKLNDKRFNVIDPTKTYLNTNSELGNVNDIVNYTLNYKLQPFASDVSSVKIKLDIPEGMTLMMDSIQSKNLTINADKIKNNIIPVDGTEGELSFSARITELGKYKITASLMFRYNKSDWEQLIGRSDVECPELTLSAPETADELSVNVHGLAAKGQKVSVYVNDKPAETLTASIYTGKYKGSVKLPKGEDGDEYSIYAKCGEAESQTCRVVYSSGKPVIKNVILSFNRHYSATMDITEVLTEGYSPVASFNPAYPMEFEITSSNNDRIYRMFVTSTKSETLKYIEAFYDQETGTWKASGYFDPNNHSYVPGKLNISIWEKPVYYFDEDFDYEQDQKFADISKNYIKNSSVKVIKETENSFLSDIKISDGKNSGTGSLYYENNAEGIYISGKYHKLDEITKDPEKYGFKKSHFIAVEDGKRVTYYRAYPGSKDISSTILNDMSGVSDNIKSPWTGESLLRIVGDDISDSPVCQLTNIFVSESISESLSKMTGGDFGKISSLLSFSDDICRYSADLMMSDGKAEFITAASVLFAIKCFNSFGGTEALSVCAGIVPPASTVIRICVDQLLDMIDDYVMERIINGQQFALAGFIRFIIDPSGKVYEAVIGNPVEGATATIYYKDPEKGTAVKWNAEDYDQHNPLLTDQDGAYLWDVPEGQWKVVFEKEGYEKAETDWMDVPPVRTEVNVAMISKEQPVIRSAEKSGNQITVRFSKFVDISTVKTSSITIPGFKGKYTIEPRLLAEGDIYADTFVLKGSFGSDIKTVKNTTAIKSYAGTAAKAGEIKVSVSALKGDANGDGEISVADAIVISRYIAGGWDNEINETAADADEDGKITLKDTIWVYRYLNEV